MVQGLRGVVVHVERANEVEAVLDELGGRESAVGGGNALDHVLDAGLGGVAELVYSVVDALVESAAVDPLLAGVPPFHGGRVHEPLSHRGSGAGEIELVGMGEAMRAEDLRRPGDQLHGTLHAPETGLFEEFGVEERAEDSSYVAVGLDEGFTQGIDGIRVLRRDGVPSGDLNFVGDEEIVEESRDEPGGGGLLDDDVNNVLAVQVAGVAEVGLYAVVVVVFAVDEV